MFNGTKDSINIWQCRSCRRVIRVLGDGCPPTLPCDMSPSSRPLTVEEIALDALQVLRKKHGDVKGMELGPPKGPLATWADGLDIKEDAHKKLVELQRHISATPSGQRVYEIPYCVFVGEETFYGDLVRVLEEDLRPTGD